VSGQTQRPKVLKWPNHELIVGYVGQAELECKVTDVWLYSFIGRNLTFPDMDTLAEALRAELDVLFQTGDFDQPLIIHLGGFELVGGEWTPRIYFIRNTTSLTPQGAYVLGKQFDCSEELSQPPYFAGQTGNQIQKHVYQHYFSFRQGYDLAAYRGEAPRSNDHAHLRPRSNATAPATVSGGVLRPTTHAAVFGGRALSAPSM
jgi:hypothetical protein